MIAPERKKKKKEKIWHQETFGAEFRPTSKATSPKWEARSRRSPFSLPSQRGEGLMSVCTAQDGQRVGMRNGGDPSVYYLLAHRRDKVNPRVQILKRKLEAAGRV